MDETVERAWSRVEEWVTRRTGVGTQPVYPQREHGRFFYEWQGYRIWVNQDGKCEVSYKRTFVAQNMTSEGKPYEATHLHRVVCHDWVTFESLMEALVNLPKRYGPGA